MYLSLGARKGDLSFLSEGQSPPPLIKLNFVFGALSKDIFAMMWAFTIPLTHCVRAVDINVGGFHLIWRVNSIII